MALSQQALDSVKRLGTSGGDIVSKLQGLAPDFMETLLELNGYVYNRPEMNHRDRELVTCTALATLGHVSNELKVHINAALNSGVTRLEIVEAFCHALLFIGVPTAVNALKNAKEVFDERDSQGLT